MTFEERQRFKDMQETIAELRTRLEEQSGEGPIDRSDALSLLEIVEYVVGRTSPERWDNMMETIADEAARRAEALTRRY
jgi:hypothetical protein